MITETPTPQEQPLETATCHRGFSIGLPKCDNPAERRFPLTPEAAGQLIERGFRVKMQEGAAGTIHYTDSQYTRVGVSVGSREESLACDIVIHLAPLELRDVRKMRQILWDFLEFPTSPADTDFHSLPLSPCPLSCLSPHLVL